jgi:hypothetical protein
LQARQKTAWLSTRPSRSRIALLRLAAHLGKQLVDDGIA